MKKNSVFTKAFRMEIVLCSAIAIAFPFVIILYFCARNVNELSATSIALGIGTALLFAAAIYLVALLLLRRPFMTMVFCVIWWAGCFLQPTIKEILPQSLGNDLPATALLILLTALAVSFLLYKIVKTRIRIEGILAAILGMVFVFNVVPIANAAIQMQQHSLDGVTIKKGFEIEDDTASPNVYWIHADGMLGMNAFEKYYNDPQSEFSEALFERGFEINPSASLEAAHQTALAIPMLTNPYSYDHYLKQLTDTHEAAMAMGDNYGRIVALTKLRQNNELLHAFERKGYAVYLAQSNSSFSPYYIPTKNSGIFFSSRRMVVYNGTESGAYRQITLEADLAPLENLSEFFSMALKLTSQLLLKEDPEDYENWQPYTTQMSDAQLEEAVMGAWGGKTSPRPEIEGLYELLHGDYKAPWLMVIHDSRAHYPYRHSENGEVVKDSMDPLEYYSQHIYTSKVILNMVDMILAADPDAVIVIQADHGLHGNEEKDFKAAFGEDADAIELWNSTMSAIRVPEKYRTGEEHYALENPLNISRYLINNFVGRNYEYLPAN